jgi:hypothetical protein
MFSDDLKKARDSKDKDAAASLFQAMPWSYPEGTIHAEAISGGCKVAAKHAWGGSGINTYETVRIYVTWPDGEYEYWGRLSVQQIRLPKYIPMSGRVTASSRNRPS